VGEIGGVTEELLDQRLVETEFLAICSIASFVRRRAGEIRPGSRAAPASAGT